jgi:hypothetical protein
MATRKSASKTAVKKSARPEKKAATKRKPTDTKKAEAKKPAAKAKEASKARATAPAPAPAKSKPAKTSDRAGRTPAPAKETKTTTPPPTSRRREAAPPPPPAAPARKRTGPPRTVAVTVGSGVVSKLGTKWGCYNCGSRFYDLNKPEPLCPKCGADQRQRPKVSAHPTPAPPPPKKQPRPMAPLLDDEDDGTVRYDEEFDLGVRTDIDEAEEDLFPTGEVEEEDVFGGPEEE